MFTIMFPRTIHKLGLEATVDGRRGLAFIDFRVSFVEACIETPPPLPRCFTVELPDSLDNNSKTPFFE